MVTEHPGRDQTCQLRRLWRLAFGDSEAFLDSFFTAAYAPERCLCASEEGRVTAALYWFDVFCEGNRFAYLYAVATHPDHRGRGLCRGLMADAHALLADRGYAGALLVPEDGPLRQMYGRMGYRDFGGVEEFSCAAGDSPVPLRPLSREEYARLRRKFLPSGGVVQEGENLAFLETYAKFYAGEDFLLAAAAEEEKLTGVELLGNRSAAPGIVKALGCARGTFRTPGDAHPFAMCLTLGENKKMPAYFGLAFD